MTAQPRTTDAGPVLALVGDEVRQLRVGKGNPRPGLPTNPDDPWHRAVTIWAESLRRPGTTGIVTRPRTSATGVLAETVQTGYLRHVGWLAGDHPDRDPWQITGPEIADWMARQGWSVSTRRQVVVSVRAFYAWAIRAGLCDVSPLAGIAATAPRRPGPNRVELPERWRTPVDEWQTWLRGAARTEGTIKTYRDRMLTLAVMHADPWSVTETDLSRWLSPHDLSPGHKRGRRATARSFYAWAVRFGHIATSPAKDLDPIRVRRALPRPAPTDILLDAFAHADPRVTLALQLATFAGLRRAEIAGLHTRDIHQNALHVVGKGGNERMIPLHPELAEALRVELLRRREGRACPGWPVAPAEDGWVFPSSDDVDRHITPRWLGRIVTKAMPPGWTPHTIRHRFATQAYAAERDLRAVQELLGHSRPETTARYAAVPDGALLTAVTGVGLSPHG